MATVFVGNISSRSSYDDVEYLFSKYGRIRNVSLKHGYGFIDFEDYRDAEDSVYELNGEKFNGDRLTVEHARGPNSGRRGGGRGFSDRGRGGGGGFRGGRGAPTWLNKYGPPTRTSYRLIVENLSSRVSWQDLKDYMRQVGDVTYADAHKIKKNEGTVEFSNQADMEAALEKLDGTEINGRKITLIEDKGGRKSQSRSRSRSRSPRSRSRSRSPASRSRDDRRSRSRSRSRSSRSRSHSNQRKSRSRSASQN